MQRRGAITCALFSVVSRYPPSGRYSRLRAGCWPAAARPLNIPLQRATRNGGSLRREGFDVRQAHLRPRDQRLRSRREHLPVARRRDRLRDRQGAHHAPQARRRLLPGSGRLRPRGGRHHARGRRPRGAQQLRAPARRIGNPPALDRRAGDHGREGAPAGAQAPAPPLALEQGADHLASPGARLQRLCHVPVREGRHHGGGRGRQLQFGHRRARTADRECQSARARIGELLRLRRNPARDAQEGLARADARHAERRVLFHGRPGRALQPRVELRLRRLEQVRRGDGPCALRPPRRGEAARLDAERRTDRSCVGRGFRQAVVRRARPQLGSKPLDEILGGPRLARPG